MAKMRKFIAYRRLERPYTRRSKYRAKAFVRSNPHNKVARYFMGNNQKDYDYKIELVADGSLQIRDAAIESARQITLRSLEKNLLVDDYSFIVRIFPHHILRENPLASGAGADRMSTGMAASFGKPIGVAAQVKKGKAMYTLECNKKHLEQCKEYLQLAATKLPCHCRIVVKENARATV